MYPAKKDMLVGDAKDLVPPAKVLTQPEQERLLELEGQIRRLYRGILAIKKAASGNPGEVNLPKPASMTGKNMAQSLQALKDGVEKCALYVGREMAHQRFSDQYHTGMTEEAQAQLLDEPLKTRCLDITNDLEEIFDNAAGILHECEEGIGPLEKERQVWEKKFFRQRMDDTAEKIRREDDRAKG